jgi:hypothetical protein
MAGQKETSPRSSGPYIPRSPYVIGIADKAAKGPVTDYGSTMLHWMRNRQPQWKGGYDGERERPLPSFIIDVSEMLFKGDRRFHVIKTLDYGAHFI